MRKMILGMMSTLDGYAAGPNDEMDWLPPFNDESLWQDAHEEMWKQLNTVDTVVLGRVTYQIWEKYWPAAGRNPASSESDRRFSRFADETQKVVLSTTLNDVKWKNTMLIRGDPREELLKLKQQSGKDIAIAGGAGLARSVIGTGLVDEFLITVHPVLLGRGKPLFDGLESPLRLKLVRTRNLKSGAVLLHYRSEVA
jgi:dihydrofolate reductase